MNLGRLARQLLHGRFYVLFGRFYSFRRAYRFLQRQIQRLNPTYFERRLALHDHSVFDGAVADTLSENLRRTGLGVGLRLPRALVEDIQDFAAKTPCGRPDFNDEPDNRFLIGNVENGRLPDGRPVILANVGDPLRCDAVRTIMKDPMLIDIVRRYTGCWPTRTACRLWWSLCAAEEVQRELRSIHHSFNYHYDVAGYNFTYAFFYLSDVDRDSGAHAVIANSHKNRPLSMLLSSRFRSDGEVLGYFGEGSVKIIDGTAGYGFVEDASCFHKAILPRQANRLMLQIRYY